MFRRKLFDGWSLPDLTNAYGVFEPKDAIARLKTSLKKLIARRFALVFGGIFTIGLLFSLRAYPVQFFIGALRPSKASDELLIHVCSVDGTN